MKSNYFVYFMSSNNRSALYIGVTNDLARRVEEHKSHAVDGFTKRYNCVNLVYFEQAATIMDAISREKQLKKWSRSKKDALIHPENPAWRDLSLDWS